MTLNDLHTGDSGVIVRIRGRGAFRKRITEMGFIRGKSVTVLKSAPLKDPIEYRILDGNVSLRRSEASLIEVNTGAEDFTETIPPAFNHMGEAVSSKNSVSDPDKIIEVALVGNPNSGKTTLFNKISRSREHVGNYAGVTVIQNRQRSGTGDIPSGSPTCLVPILFLIFQVKRNM